MNNFKRSSIPVAVLAAVLLITAFLVQRPRRTATVDAPRIEQPAAPERSRTVEQFMYEWEQPAAELPAPPPADITSSGNGIAVRHDLFQADLTLDSLEFRNEDGHVRFSRGPASLLRKTSPTRIERRYSDGVVEHIDTGDIGVEQSFVYDRFDGSDIVLEAELVSNLPARVNDRPGAGIDFLKDGRPSLMYRKAVAVDANENTLDLSIAWENGRVKMVIPAAWLRTAAFPVVLDPIIGTASVIATGTNTGGGAGAVLIRRGGAFDGTNYLALYQTGSGGTYTARLRLVGADGQAIGSVVSFSGKHPQAAFSTNSNEYMVIYATNANAIEARRFDTNLQQVGGIIPITADGRGPDIGWGNNRFCAVWGEGASSRASWINESGTVTNGPLTTGGTIAFGNGDYEPMRVAYVGGKWLVVTRTTSANYSGHLLDDATSSVDQSNIPIYTGMFTRAPQVTARPDATNPRFLVSFVDCQLVNVSVFCQLRGNFVDTNGAVGGVMEWFNTAAGDDIKTIADVKYLPSSDEFIAAFTHTINASSTRFMVQRIDPAGASIGGPEEVIPPASSSSYDPVIVPGANEQALLLHLEGSAWRSFVYSTNNPPVVNITSPAANTTVTTATVNIQGNATDSDGSVVSTDFVNTTNGASGNAPGGLFWSADVPLDPGANVIEVTATDNVGATGTSSITINYNAPTPELNLSTNALTFATTQGSSPGNQTVSITNAGNGTLSWNASDNAAWLSVSPATGTNAGTLTVSVSSAALAAGTYSGAITVSAPGALNAPQTIDVTLDVTGVPAITLSPATMNFTTSGTQTLTVSNSGTGTLNWNAADNAAWMSLSPTSGTNAGTVSVTVDTTGLAPGTYNGVITVSGNAPSQTVNVTVNIATPPVFGLSTSSMFFTAVEGGSNPPNQNISVSNSGGGTLNWTAADNSPWLSVSPTSGTNSGTVVVMIDNTGLAAGIYNGTITFSGNAPSQTVSVQHTVSAGPAIGLSPGSLTFTAGGTQTITVSNVGNGTLNWNASDNAAWMSLSPTSGTNAGTVSVTVDTAGLAPGTYNGVITVSGNAPSQTADVTLTIATPPALSVSPASLSFTTAIGTNPPTQNFSVSNTGGGTLTWNASDNSSWMSVSPASGTNAGTVTVSIDAGGLAAGTYNGQITVSGNAPSQNVAVTLVVTSTPAIGVSPGTLSFTGSGTQSLTVSNAGTGTLNWNAADNAAWLTLSPTSGTNTGTVTVTVDATGLAAGTYNGVITVSGNAPSETVDVTLTVAAGPAIGLSTTSMNFTASGNQVFTVSNTGGGTLTWNASDNAAWLSLSPAGGTNTGTVTVTADATGLAPGTYNGVITVSGNAPSQTIAVTLDIAGTPGISLSPGSLTFSAPQGGPNPVLQNVTVSNTGSAGLTWTGSDNAAWMSLTPAGGTIAAGGSQTMAVSVDVTALAPGTYNGVVTVSGNAPSQTVNVSLVVNAIPVITLGTGSLTFSGPQGGPNPPMQTVSVANSGGGTLTWNGSDNAPWLSITPASGSLGAGSSQLMTVSVDVAGLAPGTYTGTITVSGNAPSQTVAVTFTVNALPQISVTPATLSFSGPQGGPSPVSQTINVSNTGGGTLSWNAVSSAAWLTVIPATGSLASGATASLTVDADVTGLAPGVYTATLSIEDPNATNSPQTVAVDFTVNALPTILVSPSTLTYSAPQGGPSPSAQSVVITNTGGGTLDWNATDNAAWLSLAPANGALTAGQAGSTTATVDVTGLAPGTYTAMITVTDPLATNISQAVAVTLTVNGVPTIGIDLTQLDFDDANVGPTTVTVSNTGGGNLNWSAIASAGWVTLSTGGGSLGAGASESVDVTVDLTTLTAGVHTATILVSDGGASNSPQWIQVRVTLAGAGGGGVPSSGGSGGSDRCGSVGFDVMIPLGIIWLYRRRRRR